MHTRSIFLCALVLVFVIACNARAPQATSTPGVSQPAHTFTRPTAAPTTPTASQATRVPPPLTQAAPESATPKVIPPQPIAATWEALLAQGKAADTQRYEFAIKQGAQIVPTRDGKSFYVVWFPKNFAAAPRRVMIVTLHGHGSWAFDEFFLWHSYAVQRGYAILALQWWFGQGERFQDYYSPYEMYPHIEAVLRENDIARGDALLHGFSRGSANSYVVVALDNARNKFFGMAIANAGGVGLDFPSNVDIERGKFGAQPFAGTQWILVCGRNDPNPDRDGCGGMSKARTWLEKYGGTIVLFLEDPNGDHGTFHRNPANVNAALDAFVQFKR
jgi:hypothetical protein